MVRICAVRYCNMRLEDGERERCTPCTKALVHTYDNEPYPDAIPCRCGQQATLYFEGSWCCPECAGYVPTLGDAERPGQRGFCGDCGMETAIQVEQINRGKPLYRTPVYKRYKHERGSEACQEREQQLRDGAKPRNTSLFRDVIATQDVIPSMYAVVEVVCTSCGEVSGLSWDWPEPLGHLRSTWLCVGCRAIAMPDLPIVNQTGYLVTTSEKLGAALKAGLELEERPPPPEQIGMDI